MVNIAIQNAQLNCIHYDYPILFIVVASPEGPAAAAAAAKSLQSCPTLCDPIDGSPLGSAIPGIGSGLPFPSPMHESKK